MHSRKDIFSRRQTHDENEVGIGWGTNAKIKGPRFARFLFCTANNGPFYKGEKMKYLIPFMIICGQIVSCEKCDKIHEVIQFMYLKEVLSQEHEIDMKISKLQIYKQVLDIFELYRD